MSQSSNQVPALFHHPEVGQLRALVSFNAQVQEFLGSMIAEGHIRCVWHEGYQFVALAEVEPYSLAELNDEPIGEILLPTADQSSGAALLQAFHAQATNEEFVRRKRASLIEFAKANPTPTSHPFAKVSWMSFWGDVAYVGASLAGEGEARRINEATSYLEESASNGTMDNIGLSQFHKTLLSLAAPELAERFDAIWSPGCGRLEIEKPEQRPIVIAVLRRLATTFTGYRGDPEGSETPRYVMERYLDLMRLSAAG